MIVLFLSLRPKYQKIIMMKAFGINIIEKHINNELNIIRLLRNRIAHAEQTFSPKGQRINDKQNPNNYFLCLKAHIVDSQFKDVFKIHEKYIDDILVITNKYKTYRS